MLQLLGYFAVRLLVPVVVFGWAWVLGLIFGDSGIGALVWAVTVVGFTLWYIWHLFGARLTRPID